MSHLPYSEKDFQPITYHQGGRCQESPSEELQEDHYHSVVDTWRTYSLRLKQEKNQVIKTSNNPPL